MDALENSGRQPASVYANSVIYTTLSPCAMCSGAIYWSGIGRIVYALSEDELIRMVSPVIYMRRTATKDAEVGGQKIAAGEKVIMYFSAANRDPSVFPDPDKLDIRRANAAKNIAFGFGPHVCIGKRVAQLQLEEVYRQLLTRLPDIEYAGGIDVAPNNFVHAIRKLPVRFTPERRAG